MRRKNPQPKPIERLAEVLTRAAASYQAAKVIPHCVACANPCCKLQSLVLELEWRQVKTLWKIEEARSAFDHRLAQGLGPQEIRAGGDLYYIHQKPCPAYDEAQGHCRIYGQALKPVGCSDFPVYEDDGSVLADLRCEAVNLEALLDWLSTAIGPEYTIRQSADKDFPFLVTLSVKRPGGGRGGRK